MLFLGSVQTEKVSCIGAPAGREWERPRMVLSGHSDGSIRVWARELVPCRDSRYFKHFFVVLMIFKYWFEFVARKREFLGNVGHFLGRAPRSKKQACASVEQR
mgnify:CR=1 FL=1